MHPSSLLALALALSLAASARSEEVVRERFDDSVPSTARLLGSAHQVPGKAPHLALTGAGPDELGLVWVEPSFDPEAQQILVHFEYSLETAGEKGGAGGGVQLILQLGEDREAAGQGGASLGSGGLPGKYLGIALDLGPDPQLGLRGPSPRGQLELRPGDGGTPRLVPRSPRPHERRRAATIHGGSRRRPAGGRPHVGGRLLRNSPPPRRDAAGATRRTDHRGRRRDQRGDARQPPTARPRGARRAAERQLPPG